MLVMLTACWQNIFQFVLRVREVYVEFYLSLKLMKYLILYVDLTFRALLSTGILYSRLQRVMIPDAVIIQFTS